MIDPGVRIVDVDPDGFAALSASLVQRDRRPRREVSIVHRGGVVRKAVATFDTEVGLGAGDRIDDARSAGGRVQRHTGADLVTVIDEEAIADLSPRLVEVAKQCRSQAELLWRARVLWQGHQGVVTVPDPSPPRWPIVAEVVAAVPDGHWIIMESAGEDGSLAMRLAGEVIGGLLVRITSVPTGPVALRLHAPALVFDAVLRSDDPWRELRDQHAAGALSAEGLDLFAGA